jgi:glycosyltransferase involved in cell wall biosynthesis
MKRLVQIGLEVNRGSTGRIAEHIGNVAISEGWESYITFARGYNPSNSHVIKIGNKINIYFHVFNTRFLGNHLQSSTAATNSLLKKIENINPDIIQIHQLHGYFLNVEVLYKFLAKNKTPVVWTLHDCWAFTGHCAHFSLVDCKKWKILCEKCPQLHKYPKSYIDRSSYNFNLKKKLFNAVPNLTIVTVSDWLNGLAKDSFLRNHPVITIKNGVDVTRFFPRENTLATRRKYGIPDGPIVMGVGTIWTLSKGLTDYIKLRETLSPDINIVLVGLNLKQIKKLPKGLIGIARTDSQEELAELYSIADVVTSLSYQEAFGLTSVEGFACGTPTVVYNATALPELVTPEVGFVVKPGDIGEVKTAICRIIHSGKTVYEMACRQRAVDVFHISAKYKLYLNLYDSLLKSMQ